MLSVRVAVGGGRDQKGRTDTPNDARRAGIGRRQEEALGDVTEPERIAVGRRQVVAIGDRQDRARDQVPVRVQRDGNDRLDVERIGEAILLGAGAKFEIALERHADQVGDRVRELLCEIVRILGQRLLPLHGGGDKHRRPKPGSYLPHAQFPLAASAAASPVSVAPDHASTEWPQVTSPLPIRELAFSLKQPGARPLDGRSPSRTLRRPDAIGRPCRGVT